MSFMAQRLAENLALRGDILKILWQAQVQLHTAELKTNGSLVFLANMGMIDEYSFWVTSAASNISHCA